MCNSYYSTFIIHHSKLFFSIVVLFCACKTTSQVKEVKNVGFSAPKVALKKATQFADSKYRRDMSVFDFPANQPPHTRKDVMVVSPNLPYNSWRGLLAKHQNIRYFLITPGDYRKWGAVRPHFSGSEKQPYVFRYYDPQAAKPYDAPHPVQRKAQGKEAVLERFEFNAVSHWVMHGLTFRGQATEKGGKRGGLYNCFFQESNHNTLDFCLIEQVILGNGLEIFNSSNNTIQRCVIRDKIEGFKRDNIGVTVYASRGEIARNNRIIDNEIYNVTDGVQLVYQTNMGRNAPLTGEVPGTIIDNNDLYITRKLYRQKNGIELACAEDGIDIKVGTNSLREEDKVRVTNNRIWGYRTTDTACSGSSHGSGIMIHRNAKNILIENNVIFDVSRGVCVAGKHHDYKDESVTDIRIRNNIIYGIARDAEGMGAAMVYYADVVSENNTIKKAGQYLVTPYQAEGRFSRNLIIDVPQKMPQINRVNTTYQENKWVVSNEKSSFPRTHRSTNRQEMGDYSFYTKRWTAPKLVTISKVVIK